MLNVCMIGHGMMGIWHSEALQRTPDAVLHTVVGRARPAPKPGEETAGRPQSSTETFAQKYGYKKWTTNLDEALADPEVDIVIIAGPSETHAEMSLKSIAAGKHTLVEIPIAMNLEQSEAVVAAAKEKGVALGVSHPMRYRVDRHDMVRRVKEGQEHISSVQGRFFIHRLQNVGATGLQRSWTDNILWHHTTHLVDIGLWTVSGGDMATAEQRIRNIYAAYPALHPRTGIPMELVLVVETHDDQTILCNGSYLAHNRIYDVLHVTDRDDYHVDELTSILTTSEGERPIPTEQENAELIAPEFVEAVRDGREPFVPGWSVLPAMRVLHHVQEQWDAKHGKQVIPGRTVT
jgi:2-hydroxy-4-carboxymuconate semialdehyde hemiacetal dehydrogenase